jgi:hypothetical protein
MVHTAVAVQDAQDVCALLLTVFVRAADTASTLLKLRSAPAATTTTGETWCLCFRSARELAKVADLLTYQCGL